MEKESRSLQLSRSPYKESVPFVHSKFPKCSTTEKTMSGRGQGPSSKSPSGLGIPGRLLLKFY